MFERSHLHQEAVQLGVAKDNFDAFRENIYIRNMEKIADEIETIGKFLDLSANRKQNIKNSKENHINFWDHPEQSDLLDEVRGLCPDIFLYHQGSYAFHVDDLKRIEDSLHSHLTNNCNARQTQMQTMFAQERFQSNAIFECMSSIVKRCNHSMERIISNFAHK